MILLIFGLFYTFIALIPKLSEEIVSSTCFIYGPIFTIKTVLQFPPNESWSNLVNLESRKGTNYCLDSDKAWIHFPNTDKEEFMDLASSNLSPVERDFFTRSEPAKSTK